MCPPAKNTSCNAKPHPKRLTTTYFSNLNNFWRSKLQKYPETLERVGATFSRQTSSHLPRKPLRREADGFQISHCRYSRHPNIGNLFSYRNICNPSAALLPFKKARSFTLQMIYIIGTTDSHALRVF